MHIHQDGRAHTHPQDGFTDDTPHTHGILGSDEKKSGSNREIVLLADGYVCLPRVDYRYIDSELEHETFFNSGSSPVAQDDYIVDIQGDVLVPVK